MASNDPSGCLCGHLKAEHTDGACNEPTGRCQCTTYAELCSQCSHGRYAHDGVNGLCSRIVVKTRMPCNCSQYATTDEPPVEGTR